jgi:hypothetical protein
VPIDACPSTIFRAIQPPRCLSAQTQRQHVLYRKIGGHPSLRRAVAELMDDPLSWVLKRAIERPLTRSLYSSSDRSAALGAAIPARS